MNIAILDYDIGNVRSIFNCIEKTGGNPILTRDIDMLDQSDGLIVPGVGAFSYGMEKILEYQLEDSIVNYALSGKPLLGICLGMQLLFDESSEFKNNRGLGIISGKVKKLSQKNNLKTKLPNIGWRPNFFSDNEKLFNTIPAGSDMYFVHSYVAHPDNLENVISYSNYYGSNFCSAVRKDNVYGCQFHPEKSGIFGVKIIENFIYLCKR